MTFGQGIIYQHERAPTGVEEGASEELPASDAAAETAAVIVSCGRSVPCMVEIGKITVAFR